MTHPPTPERLRQLAGDLRKAANPETPHDLDDMREDILRVAGALMLHAGTHATYDNGPARVSDVRGLPAESVVAIGRDIYLCRVHGKGTPGHERGWVAAESYAVFYPDSTINAIIRDSPADALLLRHGTGDTRDAEWLRRSNNPATGEPSQADPREALMSVLHRVQLLPATGLNELIRRGTVNKAIADTADTYGIDL